MKKNFTLIELIVVIAIIAILAAIIAPNAFKSIEKAKMSQAIADLKAYKTATYTFYADVGDWPIGLGRDYGSGAYLYCLEDNGLLTNMYTWPGWDGPYIERIKTKHPWGGVYCLQYLDFGRGPGDEFVVEYNRCCYPSHTQVAASCINDQCFVPQNIADRIDVVLDDSDTTYGSGNMFYENAPVVLDLPWILEWDVM